MIKYLKVQENPASVTDLKIELYYSLGGMNYFTGRAENLAKNLVNELIDYVCGQNGLELLEVENLTA